MKLMYLNIKNIYNFFCFVLIIYFCAIISCNYNIFSYHFIPISIFISLSIFLSAKNRLELIFFIAFYHAISARSLIIGYVSFFKASMFFGILLIILTSLFFSFIIVVCSFNKNKFIQLILINILWCMPIFLLGWGSPLFTIGYFMPGLGWFGIIIFIPLVYVIYLIKIKYKIIFLIIIFLLTFINAKNNSFLLNKYIKPIHTNFNNNIIFDTFDIYKKISYTFKLFSKKKYKNINLIPEDGIPCLNKNIKKIIIREIKKNNKLFFSGATTCTKKNPKSGIILINKKNIKFIYIQRQPMPYAMYIPLTLSYSSNWILNNGIFKIKGQKYGIFVCFETVLLWTYLQTIFYRPDFLISFNSVYWDITGEIKVIQDQLMNSFSRLFNIPYKGVWNY